MAKQRSCKEIEAAAERLVEPQSGEQSDALEQFALTILGHHGHPYESTATSELFSRELPMEIQRFAAVWLVRILTKSPMALDFGSTEGLAGSLFDRVFQHDVYKEIDIEPRTQTYQKLQALTDHLQSILAEAGELIRGDLDLYQLNSLQEDRMRLFSKEAVQPFLLVLLSRSLTHRNHISSLFNTVRDYADNKNTDPIHLHDSACDACDEFESEAHAYGTMDANDLGGLARQMKAAVTNHFTSLEAGRSPELTFSPISKKYPLERLDTSIVFKIRIVNDGTGPARDLKLEEVLSEDCLQVNTESVELGDIQAGASFVLDINATVKAPSNQTMLLAQLSWRRLGGRDEKMLECTVEAQRADVDWDSVGGTEYYSLEAVTTGSDLIGRRQELRRLLSLANSETVGSGIICGQKRVGKTSLANAVSERLESSLDSNWVVISVGIGDYVRDDAASTLKTLGDVLALAMKQRVPGLANLPSPDFTNGIAPLSGFVDEALKNGNLRLLFILDEFDEISLEFIDRTVQPCIYHCVR